MNKTRGLLFSVALLWTTQATLASDLPSLRQPWAGLPSAAQILRVLTLHDYNTRVVVLGTTMLGAASGIIGTFALLRKRALMGDVISHATLPGIGLAFVIMASMGGTGKWLLGLLIGAVITGGMGLAAALLIRQCSRIKDDAALGIVLSVFFGAGVSVLAIVQKMDLGHAAGLESFIYGKTASMLWSDAMLIGLAATIVLAICGLLFKEFSLICFDQDYARTQGWPAAWLDALMMTVVTLVTVIGLQAVGLILMVALLVIPPAAARFWTHHLPTTVAVACTIGALSGFIGAAASALAPRLPAGAVIVVVATIVFGCSLIFGSRRGLLVRGCQRFSLRRKIADQHLLRGMYERLEEGSTQSTPHADSIRKAELLRIRSWSARELAATIRRNQRRGFVRSDALGGFRLTENGRTEAHRLVRNHRLWELYLITHADIAPSHVDRDADQLEHVLGEAMVARLEALLAKQFPHLAMPPSPHQL